MKALSFKKDGGALSPPSGKAQSQKKLIQVSKRYHSPVLENRISCRPMSSPRCAPERPCKAGLVLAGATHWGVVQSVV